MTDTTIPMVQRCIFSNKWDNQGPNQGGLAWMDNIPQDAIMLPPIPSGTGTSADMFWPNTYAIRWKWIQDQWLEYPDYPADYWAPEGARYDLDESDPLHPVYVLKPEYENSQEEPEPSE